jgi:hypothetical protein
MNKHNTETMRELLEKIERLEAENRDLRMALAGYATHTILNVYDSTNGSTTVIDNGTRAREVLAKWGKK